MHRQVFPQWQAPPERPGLNPGRIDIWRIGLAPAGRDPAFSQTDSHPGGRHPQGRQRDAAHLAMRDILGRYLDCPPDRLQLCVRPGGKPYIDKVGAPIEFNLSHSLDIALFAVTSGLSVGIDVEVQRDIDDPLRLARRVMPADDIARLETLPPADRAENFLDLWTRMEARQKAIGRGIFAQAADPAQLSSFSFRPGQGLHASLSISPATPGIELRFFNFNKV
ncbi:MAG: 4'-phosphopantetheinyl transferase superfamily protein [Sedimenticolaceae bacterium]